MRRILLVWLSVLSVSAFAQVRGALPPVNPHDEMIIHRGFPGQYTGEKNTHPQTNQETLHEVLNISPQGLRDLAQSIQGMLCNSRASEELIIEVLSQLGRYRRIQNEVAVYLLRVSYRYESEEEVPSDKVSELEHIKAGNRLYGSLVLIVVGHDFFVSENAGGLHRIEAFQ